MNDDLAALSNFRGTARLFPLPNLVLFPQVIQPLHIFEPRYRQMTADALEDDRLLAIVLLKPGWEADYEGRPELHAIACLGRIVADQRLEDGRYNLLLRGLSRARIVQEVSHEKLYRSAKLELLEETLPPAPAAAGALRRQLARLVTGWLGSQPQVIEQFQKLVQSELPLGTLADIFSFALPLDGSFKQQLLEQLDIEQRVRALLAYLETKAPPPATSSEHRFPPEFSDN